MRRTARNLKPDFTEWMLLSILVIWVFSSIYLINQAATSELNLLSWTSLSTFFLGFSSVTLIVIAIILTRIRRQLE
tara:strand:+ start:56 stop:283 length:228 start_codon:yes stop_codon:yes gene_type:complete